MIFLARLSSALAVVAAAAGSLAAAAPVHATPMKGLQDHPMTVVPQISTPGSRQTFLRAAKGSGVRFTRVLVRFDGMQSAPHADEIANIRALLIAAPRFGITSAEIVPVLLSRDSSNPPGRRAGPRARQTLDTRAYRDYITALATQLRDLRNITKYYTAVNEPNWYRFIPRRGGAELYRSLHQIAYTRIKAADPTAKVLFGELVGRGRPTSKRYPNGQSAHAGAFMRAVLGLDSQWRPTGSRVKLKADGVALHTYDFTGDPTQTLQGPEAHDMWTHGNLAQAVRGLRAAKRSGAINTDMLYLTEFSYKTHGDGRITGATAQRYLASAWAQAKRHRAKSFLWYQLRDRPDETWRTGLQAHTGRPFGTYAVFQRLR